MIITKRIELLIDEDDETRRKEIWKYLRELENQVFHAANLIISNQFFNHIFKERIVLTDEELSTKREKLDSDIEKLNNKIRSESDTDKKETLTKKRKKLFSQKNKLTTEARLKAEELYTTGEKNTTYQLISKEFPNMSSYIRASLNDVVTKNFSNELFDVLNGKRSLRTYRKGMPIPFMKYSMRFVKTDDGIHMNWVNGITFYLRFGRDFSNNRLIVERVINGEYKVSDSQIQIKKGKIFLLLCVDIPSEKNNLDDNISVGVDLGLNVPAYCSLSEGNARLGIGSRDDLLRVRVQMQKRRRQLQRNLKLNKGGKGRTKKLKALERLKEKERNFVSTYNHTISHQIVKFAKDNRAGVIKMEFLEGFGQDELSSFVLRNWSYFELQKMLEYKSEREGIKIVYIDPYHTSQTCSSCGNYEEGQRLSQSEFLCKNPDCPRKDKNGKNEIVFADWNASKNISLSNIVVSSKEECEYYKRNKLEKN